MIGTIGVKDLKVSCIIGIYPEERIKTQDLFIDIEIQYDFKTASQSENVADTIDYANISEDIINLAITKKYQLIETLAEDSAQLILKQYDVDTVKIVIKKPGAVPAAAYPYVELTRTKI